MNGADGDIGDRVGLSYSMHTGILYMYWPPVCDGVMCFYQGLKGDEGPKGEMGNKGAKGNVGKKGGRVSV